MKKTKNDNLENLTFVDFLEQIESEIDNSKSKNDFENIIEKLENYKTNIQANNEIFKQSIVDAIDDMIQDINKIQF